MYIRAFAQLASGILQKYGMALTDGVPSSDKLLPVAPVIKPRKSKLKGLLSPAVHSSKPKDDSRDEERMAYGSRFNYEELYVRLNNLNTARKKFVDLMSEMRTKWEEIKTTVFQGSIKHLIDVDFDSIITGTNGFLFNMIKDLASFIGK